MGENKIKIGMMQEPLVTVLIPCYNVEEFAREALDSIINQTYKNLEILCINDGSTDNTGAVLNEYASIDPRIVVVHNDENIKLIKTLNKGVQLAKGEYIARMDADDISTLNRIELQMQYLLAHPDVDLLSCNWVFLSEDGSNKKKNELRCLTRTSINFAAYLFTPIGHGFVLGKKAIFEDYHYNTEDYALHCEDYELWARMIRGGVHIENLNEVLYEARINSGSVSRMYEGVQMDNFTKCARIHFETSFDKSIDQEFYNIVVNRFNKAKMTDIRKAFGLIKTVHSEFVSSNELTQNDLKELKTIIRFQKADILFRYIGIHKSFDKLGGMFKLSFIVLGGVFNKRFMRYLRYKFQ